MHSATIFFALAAVVAAAHAGGIGIVSDVIARPSYKYSYSVGDKLTGDRKSATEVRDGEITKGSYSLVQPDGVIRTVKYIVTPLGGFQAQVINEGVAGHPAIVGVGKGIGAIAAPGLALGSGLGLGVGRGLGAIAAPGLVIGSGLGLGAKSIVGGLGLPLLTAGVGPVGIPAAGLGLNAGLGLGGLGLGAGIIG